MISQNCTFTVNWGFKFLFLIAFWFPSHRLYSQPIVQTETEILLFRAIYEGDSVKVEQLLQQGVSANTRYFTNVTALGYAASKSKLSIVQSLVNHGAQINAVIPLTMLPRTALGVAVVQQNLQMMKYLMSKGAKIDVEISTEGWWGSGTPPKMYYSALTQAVMANNLEAVNYLLEFNPEINRVATGMEGDWAQGKTPLMIAAAYDHEEIALALLNKGAKVNDFGTTLFKPGPCLSPLMETAMTGNTKLLKELIDRGADVNAKDVNNNTAFICAGARSKTKAAELLLNNGAIVNSVNSEGFNSLLASIVLHQQDIYRILSNRASAIDQVYQVRGLLGIRQNWVKPDTLKLISDLDFALIENDLERLLLGKDKFVDKVNILDQPELFQQHKIQNIEFTQFVLSKGINIHQKTSAQKTAIQLAQELNLTETMELLLNAGADESSVPPIFLFKMAIENKNINKLKAYTNSHLGSLSAVDKCELISWAVCTGNTTALRFLYSKGVKPDCADKLGITPLHNAVFTGDEALVDTLLLMNVNKNRRDKYNVQPFHIAKLLNKTNIAQKVKPDSLYVLTVFEVTKSIAETELKDLIVKDAFKGGQMNDGTIYVYSSAIEKNSTVRSPLLSWLYQSHNDSAKLKYIEGLLSRPFLVLNPNGSSINLFRQNQSYNSYPVMRFTGEAEYKNGRNNTKSASISGAYKVREKEDKEDSWDAPASSMIEISGTLTNWVGSRAFWVGSSAFAAAGGGWDNHCITVINGKCYGFKDADATTAWAKYSIKGEYKIPKVTLLDNKFNVSFPGVKVINEPNCIPVKVIQNGQEKIVQPGKTMEFNRQNGDITIIDEWNDKVEATGKGSDSRLKHSTFTVVFPPTEDIESPLSGGAIFEDRLRTYCHINSLRYWMEQRADSLSGVELYSLATHVHLLSEKARDRYKNVIKAELIGVVDFFENTQLKDLNNALLSLVEMNNVEKPDIINRLDAILNSSKTDSITKKAILVIRNQIDDLSMSDALLKLREYKKDYLTRFYKKVDSYNLLLLEYCLYIPNEQIKQQLLLDRIPVFNEHLQQPTKERLNI
ncbi:ankyrin repeat domain-containing protein [Flavobacterium phragmitis]|uniref:Ankyrin repeat-containing protein n=1 Tax=Flavobacterium phragmitis TaxID=739143 RepID=A0A1I1LKM1_9FLAO|nr:ankyrin repeat domain-containing protein [Flavobacterium phragmitis]SFC73579.1 Ankyrin repeat-containing protein [Flavobacterium phragmitis]